MESKKNGSITWVSGLALLVLVVLWPILDFGVGNLSDQDFRPGRLIWYFLLFSAIGGVVAAGLNFVLKKSGLGVALSIAAMGIFITLNYYLIGGLVENIPGIINPPLFGVLGYILAIGLTTAFFILPKTRPAVPIVVFALTVSLGIISLQNAWALGSHLAFTEAGRDSLKAESAQRSDRWPTDLAATNENKHFRDRSDVKPPNIYYIIPDMFMGENEFKVMTGKEYKMDELLEERGFKVLDNYYSNAPITRLSLAHVFGKKYFANSDDTLTTSSVRALPWRRDNDISKEFRRRGYNIHYYVDTFVNADCDKLADFCYTQKSNFHAQDLIFFERTPFFDLLGASGDERAAVWRRLMKYPYWYEIPEIVNVLPKAGSSPHFTYLHFGLPHSPYRYNEKCEYYDAYPPIRENKYRGSVKAYSKQVECAEQQYPILLDKILENDPDAWIIFQADHGVNYRGQAKGADISKLNSKTVGENLSIIGAYKLPERCLDMIPADMSPVNTFRLVFGCLDNKQPRMLPAKHYLMYYIGWQPSGEIRDVTKIIRNRVTRANRALKAAEEGGDEAQ